LGIKLPESIVARMVVTADGSNAWGLSESGVVYLPLSTLFDYPILIPEATTVFLAQDQCNPGIATALLKVNNIGKGRLTYMVLDPARNRLYLSNSGYNRVEVFDLQKQRFTTPIEVGQLPHSLALGFDGFLYVANTGGESISMVDLDAQKVVGSVPFPPVPRA